MMLEFDGVSEEQYHAVNKALGIDPETGEGDWPEGMMSHAAGTSGDGRFIVTEVWNSPEVPAAFMSGQLAAALVEGGISGPPASVTWIELISHQTLDD
jgi:hypothetical protein